VKALCKEECKGFVGEWEVVLLIRIKKLYRLKIARVEFQGFSTSNVLIMVFQNKR